VRVLLDTHAFVWFVEQPARLPATLFEMLEDATTELVISSLTPWELATKSRIGKMQSENLVLAFDQIVARLHAVPLDFTASHAITAGSLSWDHRDRFDRGLAAQSILEQLPLVSDDKVFASLPGLRVLW
jgi:PIN domain nuclease of toxin-antitoxin system